MQQSFFNLSNFSPSPRLKAFFDPSLLNGTGKQNNKAQLLNLRAKFLLLYRETNNLRAKFIFVFLTKSIKNLCFIDKN